MPWHSVRRRSILAIAPSRPALPKAVAHGQPGMARSVANDKVRACQREAQRGVVIEEAREDRFSHRPRKRPGTSAAKSHVVSAAEFLVDVLTQGAQDEDQLTVARFGDVLVRPPHRGTPLESEESGLKGLVETIRDLRVHHELPGEIRGVERPGPKVEVESLTHLPFALEMQQRQSH